jgi:hypothetical protein
VGLIIRALVVSARWAGRARRLALEQAAAAAHRGREAALEARMVVLEGRLGKGNEPKEPVNKTPGRSRR